MKSIKFTTWYRRLVYVGISAVVLAVPYYAHAAYTVTRTVMLDVPYYRQGYANSCEAAATRMALAYYGIKATDMDIVKKFGYQPRFLDLVKNEWDDPQEMYVGYVDIPNGGGYGVYGKPVARAVKEFGRGTEYVTGADITPFFLAKQIQSGNPVVIWGYTNIHGSPYTWNTPGGKTVTALKGEHARVVVGYRGSLESPTAFFVHDPINGKKAELWTAQKLMTHMQRVPGITDQAVVVR